MMLSRVKEGARSLFSSEEGERLYSSFLSAIADYNMGELIEKGVLVGFSGGADSVMLVLSLAEYRERTRSDFKILLCHVNHMIRGDEADRDESFCKAFAECFDIELVSRKIDVPGVAKECSLGIEEAARECRYSVFKDIIRGRSDVFAICLAHNSTDNLETVILNMMRGSGLRGMCGIPPVRDNIIRPLSQVSGGEIRLLLERFDIPFVTDSTNLSVDYSRNYVRHEILPRLNRLSASPEIAAQRMTSNLRRDLSLINARRDEILCRLVDHSFFPKSALCELHPSLFYAVLSALIKENTGMLPEEKHISAIMHNFSSNDYRISLCGEYDFALSQGYCIFLPKSKEEKKQIYLIGEGKNSIEGYSADVYLLPCDAECSSNIYNFSIQATLSRDIIDKGLYMRFKKDGDAYRASGMTKRLKKVFNDRGIPVFLRDNIPVFCDGEGIVWVPGLPVRDGCSPKHSEDGMKLIFCIRDKADGERSLYTVLNFKRKNSTDKKKGLENT